MTLSAKLLRRLEMKRLIQSGVPIKAVAKRFKVCGTTAWKSQFEKRSPSNRDSEAAAIVTLVDLQRFAKKYGISLQRARAVCRSAPKWTRFDWSSVDWGLGEYANVMRLGCSVRNYRRKKRELRPDSNYVA